MFKNSFILLLLICSLSSAYSQIDTSQTRGTIKIARQKDAPVYIKATADFGINGQDQFQPFPVVEGHAFPFNYTKYFNDRFKDVKIDLEGKKSEIVYVEVQVSKKGKVYFKDITNSMVNGRKVNFDGGGSLYLNSLHVNCLNFLREIKVWYPAYDIKPEVGKFKGQTVIKPAKTNRDATGIITIFFSIEPFDDF